MLLRTLTATLHTEDWLDGEEKRNAKIVPHSHKKHAKISHGLPGVVRQGVPPVPEPVHEGAHGGVEAKDQDGAGAERKEEVAHGPGGGDVIEGIFKLIFFFF